MSHGEGHSYSLLPLAWGTDGSRAKNDVRAFCCDLQQYAILHSTVGKVATNLCTTSGWGEHAELGPSVRFTPLADA